MLTQSQSVAQQSPPPDKKKRKFLSDGFRALSAGLIRFCPTTVLPQLQRTWLDPEQNG
jgi:hypothetical protein